MKKFLTFMTALLVSVSMLAQSRVVTGMVKDADGEPAIGASVAEVGTTNGTMVDFDGKFSLTVASANSKIQFSLMGFESQTVVVGNKTTIDITFKEDAKVLDEVVITGYSGTQLRSKLTSSISKVDKETFSVGLYSNPAQALSGAVSGVRVIQSSGDPGAAPSIVLRGGTSIDGGSNNPLVIVDGQLRNGMQDINPDDIESMEVMKDAGATAIYGARASNGVILITTKTGKAGSSRVSVKAKVGINYLNTPYNFLGSEDYIRYQRNAVNDSHNLFTRGDGTVGGYGPYDNLKNATPYGTGNVYGQSPWSTMLLTSDNEWLLGKGWRTMVDPLDPSKTIIFSDTDTKKENLNNPAITQDYNVSFSGGNDKGTYYAGLGYNNSEGLPVKSFYKRYNFTLNGDYKVTNWLTSMTKFNYTRANWQKTAGAQTSEENYFGRIMSVPPTVRYRDEDGNALLGPNFSDGNQNYQPNQWDIDQQSDKFTMNQGIQIDIMDGLFVRANMNWFYNEEIYENMTKDFENTPGNFNRSRNTSAGFQRNFSQTYNVVANFKRRFVKDHNVGALFGVEYYEDQFRKFSASGEGAPTDDFKNLGLTNSDKDKRGIGSEHSKMKIFSLFGNVSYDYKDKYLFSAVFRNDGYSTLINNRWGFFPGVSTGWIFTREDFLDNFAKKIKLSHGKIRLSYGENGNVQFKGLGRYTLQGSYNYVKYNGNTGFLIGNLPNEDLRWEKTRTVEVGLDANFFENKLRTGFTFYDRLTSDKIAKVAFPSSTGFGSNLTNNGKIRNRGVEFEVSGDVFKNKDWTVTAAANLSYNKNTIVQLPDNGLERNRQNAMQIYTGKKLADGTYEKEWVGGLQEGREMNMMYLWKADGIYKSYDEIPGDMIVETNGSNGQKLYGPKAWANLSDAEKDAKKAFPIQPGDVRWHDVNGDGIIDKYDKVKVGNRTPHFTGGFNTRATWKGLSLYIRMDYALGFHLYDITTPWFLGNMQGTYNATDQVFKTWSPSNPNGTLPRYLWADQLGKSNYNMQSTLFSSKGDYLALRELSLSYSIPKNLLRKIKVEGLEVSVTGQNLGYWTSAKNVATPEVNKDPGSGSGSNYALPRTLLFGLNLSF